MPVPPPMRLSALLLVLSIAGCMPPPPSAAQPRDAVPPPPVTVTPAGIAARVHRAVNEARAERGLARLTYDGALEALAHGHSADMAARGYFAHADPRGLRAGERARDAGYRYQHLGENLFMSTLYSQTTARVVDGRRDVFYRWYTPSELAEETVRAWLESPGHRANLLSQRYTHEGIGVAFGENGTVLITQNLSEPR